VEAAPPKAVEPIDLVGLRVQFAFDDYSLSNKAKENLEKLAAWMKKAEDAKIQIEGHTCEVGTNEYNLALGERRANSAKTYLEGLGVASGRLSTISYGEERPLDPGHTEESRSKNRRDEFVMTK
jgi:peptidoglycan-associated lipoprotein